jgi:signal transduction histidine kinase
VYLGVVGPLVLAIMTLLAVCIGGFSVLSSVRAYVGGESLWSKARASAVAHLRAHAVTGQMSEYRRFTDALGVSLGDKAARLELDKLQPDMRAVEAGFLAGENSAEDIPGLIRLYRFFRRTDFMEEAVGAWIEGDRLIEELQVLGHRIHLHVQRGDPPGVIRPLLVDLDVLDVKLANVEKYFSATLGRASRKTENTLIVLASVLAGLLATGCAFYVRSVMSRQLADRQLLVEANERWDLAADEAGIGLFDWQIAEDRFAMDERAAKLYGLDGGPAVFRRSEMRAMTHPEDQAFVRTRLDAAVSSGESFKNRYRIVMPDGSIRHVEAIGRVRHWHQPAKARMVGILRDVGSDIAQAQLTIDKEAAERVAQLRVQFLSRLSHELRTPLNAVLGVAQLLRIDPTEPLTVNQAKRVQILEESGTHLLHLVEDVLDISGVDSGALKLECEPLDMMDVVRASLGIVEPERAAAGVRVEDRLPHRKVMVLADAKRLRQVFVNVLSNGCKHNERGGVMSLVHGEDERHAWVTVSHDGPGMSSEQVADIFEPFRHTSQGRDQADTGLGLVIVKLLVEQMQGSVWVESEPGQGARFTVRMRRAP